MKAKAIYIIIIFFVLLVLIVGFFAHCGCISPSMAQYWILGLTLIAILLYAYFTYKILEINQATFQWNQNPILGSYIKPQLERRNRQDGKTDFKTIFHIQNFSRVHAVAKINTNPSLNGKPAIPDDKYAAKKWWYVPAGKKIGGNFSLLVLLESQKVNLADFQQKKMSLSLEIKVIYKRWEQLKDRPLLENPPDQYYFDHNKWLWVHEPTTSEIQFPVFSEHQSREITDPL
jgi:hypothetical protein